MVKPRENRVPIMMSEDELTAIDDWRFQNRVATRSEAIRRLCRLGLALDSRFDDLFKKRMALTHGFLDLWEAFGIIDADHKQTRDFDKNNPTEAAAAKLLNMVYDLETATRELHDFAYSVKFAKSIEDAFESVDRTSEIYDRLLGRKEAIEQSDDGKARSKP